ncbi:MAG TPA: OmpA family protein [Cyclobacteriaceae bacterium]
MITNNLVVVLITMNFFIVNLHAQSEVEQVKVYGKVIDEKTKSGIQYEIVYEKLPYYDDMGFTTSKAPGEYEMPLLEGEKYNIKIESPGYVTYKKEFVVEANGPELQKDFELEPIQSLIKLENLIFATGRSDISPSSYRELDSLVTWLQGEPEVVIQLEGHTDFAGGDEKNMELSRDRVESVKEYLVNKGVNKKQVITKAFGGTQPLTRERTREAKASNRRVEVRIIRENFN